MTPDIWTHALRLLAATAIGCVLGSTHDVAGKPAGTRTMRLVEPGAALVEGLCNDSLISAMRAPCREIGE